MPSIYTSDTPNVTELTNRSDMLPLVHTNISFNKTALLQAIITTTRITRRTVRTTRATTPASQSLSDGAIAGIVIAVIVLFLLLCALIYHIYRRCKESKPPSLAATPNPTIPLTTPPVKREKPVAKSDARARSTPHHVRSDRPPRVEALSICSLKTPCEEYLRGLKLNVAYLDSNHDKCFCKNCHDPSMPNVKCAHWCEQQHGWVRFGLRVSQAHQRQWNLLKEWKVSYYGTSPKLLSSILNNRFLPFDGDKLNDGTTFNSGHPDPTQCTTSPSLIYASQPKFTTCSRFRARDGTSYNVQVVLQCKQKPGTYNIQGKEWTTVTRCVSVPYGLLVRLQK